MNDKQRKYATIGTLLIVLIVSVYFLYPILSSTFSNQTYTGQYSGSISVKVEAVDESGKIVEIPTLAFISSGTRINSLRVTVTWETYSIQQGMDAASFVFAMNGTINTSCNVPSKNLTWIVNQTSMAPLNSAALNSSKQWSYTMKASPLDLQLEANKNSNYQTDFTVKFSLVWQASMNDTFDGTVEYQSGVIDQTIAVSYTSGFKINVR